MAVALICAAAGTGHADERAVELEIGGKVAIADLVIADGASLSDGVTVLTHGTLAHKDMELIASLQTMLAERGVSSLAHTLTLGLDRREGMYDCSKAHTHTHEDAITEVAAWVDWLTTQGAAKISLLGHSRGGNQVARYAAGVRQVDKVVLLAPATGSTPQEVASGFKAQFKADLQPMMTKAKAKLEAGQGDELMDVPGFIYCPAGKASARSLVSYYSADPETFTSAVAGKIDAPVLIIAGSADTVVPDVEEKLGPIADGDHVRLEVIPDAGHMFLDFYAEDAADLIAEFVRH